MMNIKFIWMIFLFMVVNLWFTDGYKCSFEPEDDYPNEFYCNIVPDSSKNTKNLVSDKTDDDIIVVRFNASLHNISRFSKSESSPFCQKFKNIYKLIIEGQELKSIDINSFQDCKNIKEIVINSTDIQELPENLFFELSNLTHLSLTENKLTTLPENIFVSQTELKYLSLNSNPFILLPPNIFKPLRKLNWLYLDRINLNLNPQWFRNLKKLIWLNLSDNKITDLPRNIFSPLKNLLTLDLSSNQLTVIHSDSFYMHSSLGTVQFYNNSINAIDEKFVDNTGSYWIDMRLNNCSQDWISKRNEVKDKLAKCFINYQPRQEQEEDYKCKFYKIINHEYTCEVILTASFGKKEQHETNKADRNVEIVKFDRKTNNITNLTSDKFRVCQRFRNVQEIDIKDAKSIDEDFLEFCYYLKVLNIQDMEIEEISESFLMENPYLTKLKIQGTKLTTLPENIFIKQQELVELHLNQNQISSLPVKIFNPLKKLRDLWLQGNKIQSLDSKLFEKLLKLATLDLSHNQIEDLPKDVFRPMTNLENLMLSSNQLKVLNTESFGTLQKLTQLNLYENKIKAIDEKLIDNTGISKIVMKGNVCSQDDIEDRDEIKESLKECFENYESQMTR